MQENLSHHRILKKLGSGGMGEVYLAQDTKLDRTVALKILPAEIAQNPERLRRFLQEAKAASSLKHANVASIYELGEEDGIHFIAMEHVEGETLEAKFKNGPPPFPEILNVAIQIADAIDEAHSKGIIHRDLKPSNIMITSRGQVKVLDFGLAKVVQETKAEDASQLPTQDGTTPGLVMGTVPFMSPEQALGKQVDQRSDIFSLGVVLYSITTGRLPFTGKTATETISKILQTQPEPIVRFNYNVPPQFEAIIRKCLEKDPSRRYQSAGELLVDLKNLKRDTEAGSSTYSTPQPPAIASPAPRRKHLALLAILLALLAVGSIYLFRAYANSHQPIDSIAVLPFSNTSHDPNIDYLSDGITENIIYRLSQISSLKVMARSTVFRFKGKDVNPQKAGKELNVRAVMMGTVSKVGDSLVIGTELVNVSDGSELWGQQYNRKMADILPIQQEISQDISAKLRLKLTGEQRMMLKKEETNNPEAFQLYLKGRYYWNKRSDENVRKGIDYFRQAIEKDPNYAMPYVGLADSYDVLPFLSFVEPADSFPKAKAAALKALEIDSSNAEAHASLGGVLFYFDWNFPEAEKEFQRAITLNPNYPTGHQFYAELLTDLNRDQEAMEQIKRAQSLDPLSLAINSLVGIVYGNAGQEDFAIDQLKRTLEFDPTFLRIHYQLAREYLRKGLLPEAIAEMKIYVSEADYGKGRLGDLANLYAKAGRKTEAYQLIDEMKELRKLKYIPPIQFASAYAGLGEKDEAFHWLDESVRYHDVQLVRMRGNLFFNSLHSDPRYKEVLRKINLE